MCHLIQYAPHPHELELNPYFYFISWEAWVCKTLRSLCKATDVETAGEWFRSIADSCTNNALHPEGDPVLDEMTRILGGKCDPINEGTMDSTALPWISWVYSHAMKLDHFQRPSHKPKSRLHSIGTQTSPHSVTHWFMCSSGLQN